jgi:hypothetical protein
VKWSGREDDSSPISSGEVKNQWSHASAPPIFLHALDRKVLPLAFKYLKHKVPQNNNNNNNNNSDNIYITGKTMRRH